MAKAKRDPSQGQGLYERDFFAWTQQQAKLLRREAIRGAITDLDLDLENLAEEIDSLGKRDRRALASQLARITEHLLKLQFGHAYEPRAGWKNSVDAHRAKARRILADSPGLKGELISLLNEGYEDDRRRAARRLGVDRDPVTLPEVCPYTSDQLLDRDWWPRRG